MMFAAVREGRGERLPLVFSPPHCHPLQSRVTLTGRGRHVLVRVLAEDVLDDHDGFLDHIVDLGLDEVEQSAHTALCRLLCGERRVWARPPHAFPAEPQ